MPPLLENMNVKLVTVVSAAAICATGLVGGTWAYASIRSQLEAINKTLEDSYTLSRASEVALRESIENPGLRKVDPRDPSRVIVVSKTGTVDQPSGR